MSKHYISPIWDDIQNLTVEQLEEQYDIEIDENGYVWDVLESMGFNDLEKWAIYTAAREESENTFIKCGGRRQFDDEY